MAISTLRKVKRDRRSFAHLSILQFLPFTGTWEIELRVGSVELSFHANFYWKIMIRFFFIRFFRFLTRDLARGEYGFWAVASYSRNATALNG